MKPREQDGVVDERLNVYGVQNLKVAGNDPTIFAKVWYIFEPSLFFSFFFSDLSIAPGNVGANTYNTAIAVGEKAAVIIAEDLGIKGVTPEWTLSLAQLILLVFLEILYNRVNCRLYMMAADGLDSNCQPTTIRLTTLPRIDDNGWKSNLSVIRTFGAVLSLTECFTMGSSSSVSSPHW